MPTPSTLTTEQKVLAALSHFSILIFGFGMVMPALFWSNQRSKTPYVSFQALQALAFQISQPVGVTFLALLGMIVFLILSLIGVLFYSETATSKMLFVIGGLIALGLTFIGFMAYLIIGVIGGISCLLGTEFEYPWLGGWIRRRTKAARNIDPDQEGTLSSYQPSEEAESELIQALCHFASLSPMSGVFVPLAIWISHLSAGTKLWFQAIQAAAFQSIQILASYGLVGAAYMLYAVMMIPIGFLMDSGMGLASSSAGMLVIGFSLLLLFVMIFISMLVMAGFQTLALIAGLKILKHQDYRYPLLGKGLDKLHLTYTT